jgi:hypothetical protein
VCSHPGCTERYFTLRSVFMAQTMSHGWPWRK